MSKIRHILSVIHYKIRGSMCFQLTHFPCDDWENIYTLSYYHHRIGSMNYYPLFRVRSWNNGVRCMSFCILIEHNVFSSWQTACFYKNGRILFNALLCVNLVTTSHGCNKKPYNYARCEVSTWQYIYHVQDVLLHKVKHYIHIYI